MKKCIWLMLLLVVLLAACGQNGANGDMSTQKEDGQFDMVGRWEMVGDLEGISYVFEFYADNSGVSFASPHSYRDLMYYIEENDMRVDYYQGDEVLFTELMEINFIGEDEITLAAENTPVITLVRKPLPETPAYVRARVALLVSNAEHTILEAEQEDERTWFATVQVAGEENTRRIRIYLDDSGVWMPSEVQP